MVEFFGRNFSWPYKISDRPVGPTSLSCGSHIIFDMVEIFLIASTRRTRFRESPIRGDSTNRYFIDKVFLEVDTILTNDLCRDTECSCKFTKSWFLDTFLSFDNLIVSLDEEIIFETIVFTIRFDNVFNTW